MPADLPSTPEAIKAEICWLQDHPLWTHSHWLQVPPKGKSWETEPCPDNPQFYQLVKLKADWPFENVRDGSLMECIDIDFVYVNPKTGTIDNNESLNTQFEIWIEAGGWYNRSESEGEKNYPPQEGWNKYNKWGRCHDFRLNCWTTDIQTALLELARKVHCFYNNDGTDRANVPYQCDEIFEAGADGPDRYISGCIPAEDGFCKTCGYLVRKE